MMCHCATGGDVGCDVLTQKMAWTAAPQSRIYEENQRRTADGFCQFGRQLVAGVDHHWFWQGACLPLLGKQRGCIYPHPIITTQRISIPNDQNHNKNFAPS